MKFKVKRNFLVRTEETIDLDPKDFISCANIEELNDEVLDYIHNITDFPFYDQCIECEQLGVEFYNDYWEENEKSFYKEWQKLKNLPEEF